MIPLVASLSKPSTKALRKQEGLCIDLALGDQLPTRMHVVERYAVNRRMQVITDTQKISQESTWVHDEERLYRGNVSAVAVYI